jgi:hypothetical protein
MVMKELPMKQFKTAMLASAFVLATGIAFAQNGTVSGQTNENANVGSSGAQVGTSARVKSAAPELGVDGGASATLKKNKAQTTGSGAASGNGSVGETDRNGH